MIRDLWQMYVGGLIGCALAVIIVIAHDPGPVWSIILGGGLTDLGLLLGGLVATDD